MKKRISQNYAQIVQSDTGMDSSNKDKWMKAIEREYAQFVKMDLFDAIPLNEVPANEKIYDSKYVYSIKQTSNSQLFRKKARLCARGDQETQEAELSDYFSTLALIDYV